MTISKDKMVSIEYTLKNSTGEVIDSSQDAGPLDYIHGRGDLISGLEFALEGKSAGDAFAVEIEAADAYGEKNPEAVFDVPKSQFDGADIEVGMQFEASSPEGSHVVTVVKITDESVTVDANHPLAGEKLCFDIKVVEVREATAEELAGGGCGCGCGCGDDDDYYDDDHGGCGGGCSSCGCGCH